MSALVGCLMLVSMAAEMTALPSLRRIDVIDRGVTALVEDGYRRSATFRALVENIEASRWRVFIQEGMCPGAQTIGCLLHTVGQYRGEPYLRIRVTTRGRNPQQVIATLGHELQHAWEVISDPDVVDADTMSAMFRRIGFETVHTSSTLVFETVEADRVGSVVLHELDLDNERHR